MYKITILLFITIMFNCCRHKCQDPTNMDCENYNPCTKEKPLSAAFDIEEDLDIQNGGARNNWFWYYYDIGDTLGTGWAYFEPHDSTADYYEWHIGGGTYKKQKVHLTIPQSMAGQKVDVMLIIKKEPNKICFPDDDGIDTVKRTIYIADYYSNAAMTGRYHGYDTDNPTDTYNIFLEVSPKDCCVLPLKKTPWLWFGNIPKFQYRNTDDSFGFAWQYSSRKQFHCNASYLNNVKMSNVIHIKINNNSDSIFVKESYYFWSNYKDVTNKYFIGSRIK